MTALTTKQRAKVNAALCIIHDNGFDAEAVTQLARNIIATGRDARSAYEQALNTFIADNPEAGPAITGITRLVEASSPATIAQYDAALSHYIETGDGKGLEALAPTIAQDLMALAVHNGEVDAADVATHGLAAVDLGFTPGPLLVAASSPPKDDAHSDAVPGIRLPEAPPPPITRDTGSQLSAVPGAGYVTTKAQAARIHYSGFAPDAPALHGMTPNAAREAARAAASSKPSFIPAASEGAA